MVSPWNNIPRNTALLLCLFGALSWKAPAQDKETTPALPDGEGKALVQKICTGCHGLDTALDEKRTTAQWKAVVDTMVGRGAEGTDADFATVVAYLGKNFGKAADAK